MKNLILLLVLLIITSSSANAMKVYNYDSNGNRVYYDIVSRYGTNEKFMKKTSARKYINNGNSNSQRTKISQTNIYDGYGNKLGRISRYSDGQVYIRDGNGKILRRYAPARIRNTSQHIVRGSGAFYRTR